MSVPVCPDDYIVVRLDRKFKDTSDGGLFIDTGFSPGDHATVTGIVVSVPLGISNHFQKKNIVPEVQPGDELAFSYRVVYDQRASDNAADVFYEEPALNPYITNWAAPNGQRIIRRNKGKNVFDAAIYHTEKDKAVILEQTEGDHKHVNAAIKRWMPANETIFDYRNCFVYNGEEYWRVDYPMAHAVKRDGEIIMIGGFTLLECPEGGVPRDRDYKGSLEIYGDVRIKAKVELRAKLVSIGTPLLDEPKLKVKAGDLMVINSRTAQEYSFWGKEYILVRQNQLLAVA